MSSEDPSLIEDRSGRESRAATSAWLRGLVRRHGINAVARARGVSAEAIARFCAGFDVRRATAERLERAAFQQRTPEGTH